MSVVASVAGSTVADMSESDMHLLNPAPFGRILPAMITPMKPNGDVDFEAAQKLAKQLVADGADGLVDLEDLRRLCSEYGDCIAAMMMTNPNTLGLFERQIPEIAKLIHGCGGLMYYDGANLNPMLGACRPGDMGPSTKAPISRSSSTMFPPVPV